MYDFTYPSLHGKEFKLLALFYIIRVLDNDQIYYEIDWFITDNEIR